MRSLFSLPVQLGLLVVLLMIAGFTVFLSYKKNQREVIPAGFETTSNTQASPSKTPSTESKGAVRKAVQESGQSVLDLVVPTNNSEDKKDAPPAISEDVKKQMLAMPTPITLFSINEAPKKKARVSSVYAPYGRLIKCQLINAVDSANIDTPLIAVCTEDVWNRDEEGHPHIVIAAGDEVHGRASKGRSRDRIDATGNFVIVRRNDNIEDNGVELVVKGVALDCDFDPNTGLFGLHDASAGIRGDLIETNEYAELKLFTSTFISKAASGLKDVTSAVNVLTGSTVQTPKATLKTALAEGSEAVAAEMARVIKESIGKDGYYVAIPPGKRFYLYVDQTIDFSHAQRGLAAADAQPEDGASLLKQLTKK
jgi:uncharacterized protein YcgL (UPF0745 family)